MHGQRFHLGQETLVCGNQPGIFLALGHPRGRPGFDKRYDDINVQLEPEYVQSNCLSANTAPKK